MFMWLRSTIMNNIHHHPIDSIEDDDVISSNPFVELFNRSIKVDHERSKILSAIRFHWGINFGDFDLSYYYENDHRLVHIGSGSYADVFRSTKCDFILKFIRLLPQDILDRIQSSSVHRATRYLDAYNEFQISVALSQLNKLFSCHSRSYVCHTFPNVHCCYLTNEEVLSKIKQQKELSKTSTDFSSLSSTTSAKWSDGVRTFEPYVDIFDDYFITVPRENLVIVMEDCGELLADIVDQLCPYAMLSILKQIIIGLMIAERALEFEHRDLHYGNILVQPYHKDSTVSHDEQNIQRFNHSESEGALIEFIAENQQILIPSYGYQVKIIDTTFSRLKYRNEIYYKDMTSLFEKFDQQTEDQDNNNNEKESNKHTKQNRRMQDVIYEQMAKEVQNDWKSFHPKTNILWIKYVIYKLLKSLNCTMKKYKESKRTETNNIEMHSAIEKIRILQVIKVLEHYNQVLDHCSNLTELYDLIRKAGNLNKDLVKVDHSLLNDFVKITIKQI